MTRVRWALSLCVLAGCGGTLEPASEPARVESARIEPVAQAAADPARALRHAHAAIGCFLGSAVDQLLGAADRCGALLDEVGADPASRAAVAGLDPQAVDAIARAVLRAGPADAALPDVVRAVADASREGARARRAGADEDALAEHAALARLFALDSKSARVPALVLSAGRLEAARGLAPRAKIAAATPTFVVVLGLARPTTTAPGTWLSFATAAAAQAGHPVLAAGSTSSTHDRAQVAFLNVAWGLADRLALAGDATEGELRALARAYERRLRDAVAEGQRKAKAKAEAKTTADAADKKTK